MKLTTLIKLAPALLVLATGCASTAPAPEAPKTTAALEQDDVSDVMLPAYEEGVPGSMEMSWEPPPPPPEKKIKPRRLNAQPQALEKKRHLFALPTTFKAGE
ncbi:MAG: hypothetical protein KC731_06605 [Myxococcales bacterium]|nr:hypothetical protein [Myxococcales bacterium]